MRQLVLDSAAQPIRNIFINPHALNANSGFGQNTGPGGGTGTPTYGTNNSPVPGGTFRRITWTTATTAPGGGQYFGVAGSSVTPLVVSVTPGEVVSVGCWVRPSINQRILISPLFYDAAGAQTAAPAGGTTAVMRNLAGGSWTWMERNNVTVTANSIRMIVLVYATGTGGTAANWAVNDYLDITGCTIIRGPKTPGRYYDSSESGWRWSGAVDLSESVGYPDPVSYIRNRIPNPSITVAGQWAGNNATLYSSSRQTTGGVDNGPFLQVVRTATNPSNVAASIYIQGGSNITSGKVTPGETIYGSLAISTSAANRRVAVYFSFRDYTGASLGTSTQQFSVMPEDGSFNRYFSPATIVPANAESVLLVSQVLSTDGSFAPEGEITKFDQAFVGAQHSGYFDGDSPEWRWLGTPHASESVGYAWPFDPMTVRRQVRNLIINPHAVSGTGAPTGWNASRYTAAGTAPALRQIAKMTDPDGTTFGRLIVDMAEGHSILIGTAGTTYPAGTVATGLIRVRASRAMGVNPRIALVNAPSVPVEANIWTWIRSTVTLTADRAIQMQPIFNSPQPGDTLDLSHAIVVVGNEPTLEYGDGDTLGWRWAGTAHASESFTYVSIV